MTTLIAVVGPTAVGKTKLAIALAKLLAGEIISGDSMQVYRHMDIGTAKPSSAERQGIPHHLMDIKEPEEDFNLAQFVHLAEKCIKTINARGRVPILAGGTGLYIKALLEGYALTPAGGNERIRSEWQALAEKKGNAYIYHCLQKIDPITAPKIHPNDRRRIIRALEIFYSTGKTPAQYLAQQRPGLKYNAAVVGLTMPRSLLYERINQRVDEMLAKGLIDEVAALLVRGVTPTATAMQAIGYKEIVAYLQGHLTLSEAVATIKQASRRYAKRQMTWFRRMPYIKWFDATVREKDLVEDVYKFVAGKLNIK